jgi:hypothetical protein
LSQAGGFGRPRRAEESEDEVLRAKYLDYCSARMAEVLLRLTPDEMYVLAEGAAEDSGITDTRHLSYETIVRLATERLCRRLSLPPFETWATAYREDPQLFESELLGLWRTDGVTAKGAAGDEGASGA